MEIRQYLLLGRKWAWLLILGLFLGGVFAYIFSMFQPIIYQAATKIMVSRAQDLENQGSYYYVYNDIQLAQTYSQIINTVPILQSLSARLGYEVDENQITVRQISNSQLIELSATDGDPNRAAEIANTLFRVFVDYNASLQDERYKSTEENLKAQIAQIENQVLTLQSELTQVNESTLETQRLQLQEQAQEIEKMLAAADTEVIQIETQLESFIPTPAVTNTPNPSWIIPTSTPVPVPTPTLSSVDQIKFKELQVRRDQLNEMRSLFQQAYGNILVLKQSSNLDPVLRQNQIQTTLALYQQIYSNLLSSYENVRLARLRSTPNIVQVEPATVPENPIQPRPLRNSILGAMSGLLLMGSAAFLFEYLDDTIKTPEDVNQALKLSVLGLIGDMNKTRDRDDKVGTGIFVLDNTLSPITEGFRTLRTNLDFACIDKPLRIVEITSAGPSEGKTTIAVNLAAIIAQGGRKVILLDADFRRPSIHKFIGIPNQEGLGNLFHDLSQLEQVMKHVENLPMQVIPTGPVPPNPSELLASERMGIILEKLKEISDVVVIDTPPTIISDAIALSAKTDGVVVIVKPGSTRIGAAQVMMEQLTWSGVKVFGVVLNQISSRNTHYYSKYSYYSSDYYRTKDHSRHVKEANGEGGDPDKDYLKQDQVNHP